MTDFLGGYSSRWEVREVVPETWDDGAVLGGVRAVSVDRSNGDAAPLLESGSMTLDADAPGFDARWCRVYMVADQGDSERFAMATLLFEHAKTHAEKGVFEVESTGKSVLQPAADVKLAYGAYAPAGTDGAAHAARLVASCTPAPVTVEGSFTLVEDYVFDIGSSCLEAAWKLLDAAGWCMQVDGMGRVTVRALPTEPALELSRANAGLLVPGVDDEHSLADVPNRYYAVDDGDVAVAVNDDPLSPASHAARGRWVDLVDDSPAPVDGETLEMYAERKLAEASVVRRTYAYDREYWPGVHPFSLVRGCLPETGLECDMRVVSQSLSCGMGVKVTEKCEVVE